MKDYNVPPDYRSAHDYHDRRIEDCEEKVRELKEWQVNTINTLEKVNSTIKELTYALVGDDRYGNHGLVGEMKRSRQRGEEWDKWKWWIGGMGCVILIIWEVFKGFNGG